jgi:hypothetical protein
VTATKIEYRLPALGRCSCDHALHCLIRGISELCDILSGNITVRPSGPLGSSKLFEFTHGSPHVRAFRFTKSESEALHFAEDLGVKS